MLVSKVKSQKQVLSTTTFPYATAFYRTRSATAFCTVLHVTLLLAQQHQQQHRLVIQGSHQASGGGAT